MFKAVSIALGANGLTSIALFARNILVARLLSVEDFGIASLFAVLFTLIEAATEVGMNMMIVQDKRGDDQKFLSTIHSIQMLRGIVGAVAMVALAWPYALLVKTPEILWAYQLMAIVPLARGLLHYDIFRFQRHMNFRPFGLSFSIPPILSIAVVLASYYLTPDYRVMLWAIIAQQCLQVVVSHLLAERPYRWAWDRGLMREAVRFGLPLLGNGLLTFFIMNGDRVVVANVFDPVILGWFSAAFLLSFTPSAVLGQTMNSVFLPLLSKAQDTPERFAALARATIETALLIGLVLAVGLSLFGPAVMLAAFGPRYAEGLVLLIVLGVMQAMRLCKTGPIVVAISRRDTINPMIGNLLRIATLPVAYVLAQRSGSVLAVAYVALLGEALAMLASMILLKRRLKVAVGEGALSYLLYALTLTVVLVDAEIFPPTTDMLAHAHWLQLGIVALSLAFLVSLRGLRQELGARVRVLAPRR